MKLYFFVLTMHSHRNGNTIGKTCGVISAENEGDAEKQVWNNYGADSATLSFVEEIDPAKGYKFTVYKSEI